MAQVSDDASLTLIHSLEDATTVLNRLVHLVDEIRALSSNDSPLSTEEDYETQVNPRIEEATIKYQLLAGFLQNHRGHEKEFRTIQRTFVNTMQDLQQVQREANKKRETLIDAEFMKSSMLSQEELQTAKEELREAHEIAKEAVIVRELFQEVGTIIHDQGKGIAEIEKKVDTIKIEIGQGVSELEQAVRLQYEARQKYICMVLTFLIILAIIIVPIVLTFI